MQKARTGASQTRKSSQSQLEFPLAPPAEQEAPAPDPAAEDEPVAEDDDSPTFAMVRESGIDGEKRCLFLVVESTQGERFRLDFTPGCIPLAVTALSSELGFLCQHQPDAEAEVQPIVIESCQLGETADGCPALLARMEGGGELPLQMSLQDLRHLSRQIEDYIRSRALGTSRP